MYREKWNVKGDRLSLNPFIERCRWNVYWDNIILDGHWMHIESDVDIMCIDIDRMCMER